MQPDDLGTQNLLQSFLGLLVSVKPNLSLMGQLGMVPDLLKWGETPVQGDASLKHSN